MKEDIIRMAREAGIDHWWESGNEHREVLQQHLERFAALVRADERKAVCRIVTSLCISDNNAEEINRAVRARGEA